MKKIAALAMAAIIATATLAHAANNASAHKNQSPKTEQTQEQLPLPAYGDKGSFIQIRIYTDYDSPQSAETNRMLAPVFSELAKKTIIVFVDLPEHPDSIKYSEAFLAAQLARPNDLATALRTRAALFDAASKRPYAQPLQVLKDNNISTKYDRKAIATIFTRFYAELTVIDNIYSSPTVVIQKGSQKTTLVGNQQIYDGIQKLIRSFYPQKQPKTDNPQ